MQVPVQKGTRTLREDGIVPFSSKAFLWGSIPLWNSVTSRRPVGTNIFDRDWDLLVILDACRVDALRTAAESVPWLDGVERVRSVGSMSAEWMLNTFTDDYLEEIAGTALVSRNVWSHRIFNERFHERAENDYDVIRRGRPRWNPVTAPDFGHYELVRSVANQDDGLHHDHDKNPHVLTDRAIAVGREEEFDRMIVHYTLPHLSFIADALDWDPDESTLESLMDGPEPVRDLRPEEESYEPARRGDVSLDAVREAYLENLRLGLAYVEVLLENVDAERVVVTSDHGEGFGEYGIWGHPYGWPLAPVKSVPWATTTASDERTYEPRYDRLERLPDERESIEILEDLGYL